MANQGKSLDRKKLLSDPIMITAIMGIFVFLLLFILYPLAILLADSADLRRGDIRHGEVLPLPALRKAHHVRRAEDHRLPELPPQPHHRQEGEKGPVLM